MWRAALELTADPDAIARVQSAMLAWFDAERIELPWRQRRTPYAVLVSEFMLQQTQRERVVPKYRAFMLRFPDLPALAAASTADVIREWAGLGYNSRALRLHQLARRVVADGGEIPAEMDCLRELPGVGDYTARAVLCFGFDQPIACVDTNIRRVLRRVLVGSPGPMGARTTPAADLVLAERALVRKRAADWNAALMDLGALICRARMPMCDRCPVSVWCAARPVFTAGDDEAPRKVAEPRQPYSVGGIRAGAKAPFAASDRFLRGRIVDVLRALPDDTALALTELARLATGMALPPQTERVQLLVERLEREGLVVAESAGDGETRYRLPV